MAARKRVEPKPIEGERVLELMRDLVVFGNAGSDLVLGPLDVRDLREALGELLQLRHQIATAAAVQVPASVPTLQSASAA